MEEVEAIKGVLGKISKQVDSIFVVSQDNEKVTAEVVQKQNDLAERLSSNLQNTNLESENIKKISSELSRILLQGEYVSEENFKNTLNEKLGDLVGNLEQNYVDIQDYSKEIHVNVNKVFDHIPDVANNDEEFSSLLEQQSKDNELQRNKNKEEIVQIFNVFNKDFSTTIEQDRNERDVQRIKDKFAMMDVMEELNDGLGEIKNKDKKEKAVPEKKLKDKSFLAKLLGMAALATVIWSYKDQIWDGIKKVLTDIDWKGMFTKTLEFFKDFGSFMIKIVTDSIPIIWEAFKGGLTAAWGMLTSDPMGFLTMLLGGVGVAALAASVAPFLFGPIGKLLISNPIKWLGGKALGGIGKVLGKVIFNPLKDFVTSKTSGLLGKITKGLTGGIGKALSGVGGLLGKFTKLLPGKLGTLVTTATTALTTVSKSVVEATNITSKSVKVLESSTDVAKAGKVADTATDATKMGKTTANATKATKGGFFSKMWSGAKDLGGKALSGVKNVASKAVTFVKEKALSKVMGFISKLGKSKAGNFIFNLLEKIPKLGKLTKLFKILTIMMGGGAAATYLSSTVGINPGTLINVGLPLLMDIGGGALLTTALAPLVGPAAPVLGNLISSMGLAPLGEMIAPSISSALGFSGESKTMDDIEKDLENIPDDTTQIPVAEAKEPSVDAPSVPRPEGDVTVNSTQNELSQEYNSQEVKATPIENNNIVNNKSTVGVAVASQIQPSPILVKGQKEVKETAKEVVMKEEQKATTEKEILEKQLKVSNEQQKVMKEVGRDVEKTSRVLSDKETLREVTDSKLKNSLINNTTNDIKETVTEGQSNISREQAKATGNQLSAIDRVDMRISDLNREPIVHNNLGSSSVNVEAMLKGIYDKVTTVSVQQQKETVVKEKQESRIDKLKETLDIKQKLDVLKVPKAETNNIKKTEIKNSVGGEVKSAVNGVNIYNQKTTVNESNGLGFLEGDNTELHSNKVFNNDETSNIVNSSVNKINGIGFLGGDIAELYSNKVFNNDETSNIVNSSVNKIDGLGFLEGDITELHSNKVFNNAETSNIVNNSVNKSVHKMLMSNNNKSAPELTKKIKKDDSVRQEIMYTADNMGTTSVEIGNTVIEVGKLTAEGVSAIMNSLSNISNRLNTIEENMQYSTTRSEHYITDSRDGIHVSNHDKFI